MITTTSYPLHLARAGHLARAAQLARPAVAACVLSAVLSAAGASLAAEPKDGPKAGTIVYEATYGAWSVVCNPCASYEESVCTMWPESESGSLSIFPTDEGDPKPPLAMTYYPGRELAFETQGTLTVSVDGAPVRVIEAPNVIYTAMYGDLFIEAVEVAAMLPDLREGGIATLEFLDADGSQPDAFPLDGFGAALDDLLAQLPFERASWDDSESCTY